MTWTEITEAEYTAALECLPPAARLSYGFLLGEPETHVFGRPVYAAYLHVGGRYFAGSRAMSAQEFRKLNIAELQLPEHGNV
jgi:hypothetical protein